MRGLVLRGAVWPGGASAVIADGVVVIDARGRVDRIGPAAEVDVPESCTVVSGAWVGPGIVDAHVHLAFGSPEAELAGGVVAVRDLGAPARRASAWRTPAAGRPGSPIVAVAGPLVTAPGGYPSRSWGADGFALFVDSPRTARQAVRDLAASGVDVVKIALEPAGGPVPEPADVAAVVGAAHDSGLAVTAHALTVAMVDRALDAGVDELCHVPTARLPADTVERIASARVPVVSTLHTFSSGGGPGADGTDAAANAADLVAAGVPLLYGTDLGNAGTTTGVDPRELARLAEAGLGPLGALRAATEGAARAAGFPAEVTGRLDVGQVAHAVVLAADPLIDPGTWRRPIAVVSSGHLLLS